MAYKKLGTVPDKIKRIVVCFSYDIICNRQKYIKEGKIYRVKNKDCFFYTVIGDLNSLKKEIEKNKNWL